MSAEPTLCRCGCGLATEGRYVKTGEPRLYRPGHNGTPESKLAAALAAFHKSYTVSSETGCWEWTGRINGWGYGEFYRRMGADAWFKSAHRWSYTYLVAPIPEGYQVDHLCRNRRCVNPDHLEAVTQAENIRRAWHRTHCKRGHEQTPAAVSTSGKCLLCRRVRRRALAQKARAA